MDINLNQLTLEQKVGQLLTVQPLKQDKRFTDLGVGSILIRSPKYSESQYKDTISFYNENSNIKPLMIAELEGSKGRNPFSFYDSKPFGEITSPGKAYTLGKEHGNFLKGLGFDMNFSPVVETTNLISPGRTFPGPIEEVKEKSIAYMLGMKEEGIMATAKHYPNGSFLKDTHFRISKAEISKEELIVYDRMIEEGVESIMIGHPIVTGAVNSQGKPASLSKEIVGDLEKKFNGLLFTDSIHMIGLRLNKLFRFQHIYSELINLGYDSICDIHLFSDHFGVKRRRNNLLTDVDLGIVPLKRIDNSVKKILELKDHNVI